MGPKYTQNEQNRTNMHSKLDLKWTQNDFKIDKIVSKCTHKRFFVKVKKPEKWSKMTT